MEVDVAGDGGCHKAPRPVYYCRLGRDFKPALRLSTTHYFCHTLSTPSLPTPSPRACGEYRRFPLYPGWINTPLRLCFLLLLQRLMSVDKMRR